MFVVIDTEFTRLTKDAELISLGAVSENGCQFYCELTPVAPEVCSKFVREVVLPLLEGGPVACPRAEFGERLGKWLSTFENPVLLSDSEWDIYMLRHALTGQRDWRPGTVRFVAGGHWQEVMLMTLAPLDGPALARFERTTQQHFKRDPRQHHALVDAQAILAGLLAVHGASGNA